MRLSRLLLSSIALLTLAAPAQANIFVIGNDMEGFTIAFPDSWGQGNNQKPDDKLTIFAPENGDQASCKVKVREDRRYNVYPPKYNASIQTVAYSRDFWNKYLGEYDNQELTQVADGAHQSVLWASKANANYTTADTEQHQKRATMIAGVYKGRAYVVECSALTGQFNKYTSDFSQIMDSFTPHAIGNGQLNSFYRDFQNDRLLVINRQGGADYSLYY